MINFLIVHLVLTIFVFSITSDKVFLKTNIANYSANGIVHVFLNCTTITPPLGYVAEFQHNNRTVASIGYYNETCLIKRESCPINECACKPNYYMINMTVKFTTNFNSFTCQMRFNEPTGNQLILRTVTYIGSDIIDDDERTVITNKKNDTKETDSIKREDSLRFVNILVACGIVLFVIVVVAVVCLRKGPLQCRVVRRCFSMEYTGISSNKTETDKNRTIETSFFHEHNETIADARSGTKPDSYSRLDMTEDRGNAISESEVTISTLSEDQKSRETSSFRSLNYPANKVDTSKRSPLLIRQHKRASSAPITLNTDVLTADYEMSSEKHELGREMENELTGQRSIRQQNQACSLDILAEVEHEEDHPLF